MVQYVMRKMTLKKRVFPLKKFYVEKHMLMRGESQRGKEFLWRTGTLKIASSI